MYATGQAWAHCPRSALRRVLDSIEKEYALTFRIGQETEFYVLGENVLEDPSKIPQPVDTSLYCQSWAYDNVAGLMDDISEAVENLSIPVEQLHAESGPGQFEIAVGPAVGNFLGRQPTLRMWYQSCVSLSIYSSGAVYCLQRLLSIHRLIFPFEVYCICVQKLIWWLHMLYI